MHALIDKATNTMVAVVDSTDGYDLSVFNVVPVTGDPAAWTWNGSQLVPRPPTPAEETATALTDDPRWAALKAATPAQIEAWLASNVSDLNSARRVLKVLVLAVQLLARSRS